MYLRNWEHNATTGTPIAGATVEVRAATLTSPNTGAIIASTTTDVNGMWEFPTLPDAPADVKVLYSGNVWWHKGMTKHSVDTIYYVTPTPRTDNFLRNGGFEQTTTNGPWTVTNVIQTVYDSWLAVNGTGSSATLTRDTAIHAPDSDASAKLVQTRVSGSLTLFQNLLLPASYRGKQLSVSFQVRQGVASSVRAYITDSAGTTFSATSVTTGSFVTLTATRTIDAASTVVQVGISVDVSDTVYIDDAISNLGAIASSYQPEYWFPGAVTDDMIGVRSIDQSIPATSGSQTLSSFLSMIANRIKAITGATNWYDAPAATLAALNSALSGKVSKVGDTMSGLLTISTGGADITGGVIIRTAGLDVKVGGVTVEGGGVNIQAGGLTVTGTATSLAALTASGLITANAGISVPSSGVVIGGGGLAVNAGGATVTGVLDATTLRQGGTNVQNLLMAHATLADTATSASSASDANALGGIAASGYARRTSGTYTGTGSANAKSVGFQAEFVLIMDHSHGSFYLLTRTGALGQDGGSTFADSTLHIDTGTTFTVGTTSNSANVSGRSYSWVAYS